MNTPKPRRLTHAQRRVSVFAANLWQFLSVCVRIVWVSIAAPGVESRITARRYRLTPAYAKESPDASR